MRRYDGMAGENFLRTYTIKCGQRGKKGFEIGNLSSSTETVLHVSFSVEKSDTESPNSAKVQIWNLSESSLKVLDKKDCVIELKAGYGTSMAPILIGDITSVITTPDNADRLTELEVTDGRVALRDAYVNLSYNGSVNCKRIYEHIAGQMGCTVVFSKELKYKTLPNGFSFVGKGKAALKKITKCCRHTWSIQNNVLQITKKGTGVSAKGFVLSGETGLLSIPKRITLANSTDTKKAQTGWEVEYLLNGAIGINDIIQLKSEKVNGYFLVKKVTIDGDNYEGDWICTAQLIKI